jgi:hypothetical protein
MMRAQVSTEYILVAAMIMMLLLPGIYLFYSYSHRSTAKIGNAQLDKFGRDILRTAESVYYMGNPARMTIEGQLPDKILDINASIDWNNGVNELVFIRDVDSKRSEYVYSSAVNINGSFFERDKRPGIKKVHLEAFKTEDGIPFVFINFGGRCPSSDDYNLRDDGMTTALLMYLTP